MENKIEKKTSMWLGMFVVVMSIVYIFVTLGRTNWITYIAIIWGLFLSVFLFLEAGVMDYFRKKEWRKIGFGDVVVWLSIGFGAVILVNSLLLIGTLKDSVPLWISNFAATNGVIAGVGGAILGIIHIMMPRFK